MSYKIHSLLIILICSFTGRSQLYFPNTQFYNDEIQRLSISDSVKNVFYNNHLSLKPILDKRTNREAIYGSNGKHYYWITQKLFKENFIIFEGEDYWCAIDPILDLELGADLSADSLDRLYWNTRGIRVQARFFDKVAFSTSFYENQAILPFYQQEYADNHGEFIPNADNTIYNQVNAVIPGYARTKPFKTNGYDFAFAEGQVTYVPNSTFNVQIGNGNHFIGNGYRSLLLSDYSINYPFAKAELNFLNGRIQYNTIYALHQNLYRLSQFTTPEATYERKIGTYHYLDFAVNTNLQIGLFEGNLWKRTDSSGTQQPDWMFLNPVIYGNTAAKGFQSNSFSSVLGLNVAWTIKNLLVYGQLVMSDTQLGGYQGGIKLFDLLIPKLDASIEYNHVELNTYLSSQERYNYSHYNLPLAHPLVAGFDEITARLSYQHKRFFVQNRFTLSQRIRNDSLNIGNAILLPSGDENANDNYTATVIYNQLELGYRFNKNYNLEAVVGHLYRNETQPTNNPLTNYTYIGIRTRLRNKTLDF